MNNLSARLTGHCNEYDEYDDIKSSKDKFLFLSRNYYVFINSIDSYFYDNTIQTRTYMSGLLDRIASEKDDIIFDTRLNTFYLMFNELKEEYNAHLIVQEELKNIKWWHFWNWFSWLSKLI